MAGPKRIEDMDLPELLNQQAAAAAPGGATEARVIESCLSNGNSHRVQGSSEA
jgi:hypothetical protein